MTMFIAFQADLNKAEPTALVVRTRAPERIDHAERAAQRLALAGLAQPILMGKLLGFALAAIGLSGLYFS